MKLQSLQDFTNEKATFQKKKSFFQAHQFAFDSIFNN